VTAAEQEGQTTNSRPIALVTGASRGIGAGIARRLAADGHDVAIAARGAAALEELRVELCTAHPEARFAALPVDLAADGAAEALVARCAGTLGAPTVLVNNAGTAPSARLQDTDDATLALALRLHVEVPFALIRAALPSMRSGGVAVQLASSAGLRGFPFTAAYSAAKHGMVGLTRALAAEWARTPELRAFAVCPGFVDTEITRRAAEEIAARGRSTAEEAFTALAAMNRIGRMHSVEEVASAVTDLVRTRPRGVVLDLDRDPPLLTD
jgi:NAD(P)-dependent dehydrogenase (short-subunit alcohol dehydrogenase family)